MDILLQQIINGLVLGSMYAGIATPTESASIGAAGALLFAIGAALAGLALTLGFAGQAPAADAAPIKIGVYLPLTGQNAFGGQLELEGVRLAHKEMPTVLGRPVDLVVVDNKSDKVEAANAVTRLTARDKVTGIIGTYGSSLAMAGGGEFIDQRGQRRRQSSRRRRRQRRPLGQRRKYGTQRGQSHRTTGQEGNNLA